MLTWMAILRKYKPAAYKKARLDSRAFSQLQSLDLMPSGDEHQQDLTNLSPSTTMLTVLERYEL